MRQLLALKFHKTCLKAVQVAMDYLPVGWLVLLQVPFSLLSHAPSTCSFGVQTAIHWKVFGYNVKWAVGFRQKTKEMKKSGKETDCHYTYRYHPIMGLWEGVMSRECILPPYTLKPPSQSPPWPLVREWTIPTEWPPLHLAIGIKIAESAWLVQKVTVRDSSRSRVRVRFYRRALTSS
jgi:hypothetical protein